MSIKDQQLTIGLFGFGVVGEGIYKVLQQTPTLNATIKKICIRHPDKVRNAPSTLFTTNADELLNDDTINVIVELIDDSEAAFEIVKKAFTNKKAVVSANKKMIAEHQEEIFRLQKESGVSFLYEAAVCGSIPVIRNLEEYYDNDLLSSFSGIVNGSTNYILTRMSEEGISYEEALKQAQQLGFAESDPELDVEGTDAVNKLSIVLHHAYGLRCSTGEILKQGITSLHASDAQYAAEKGYKIKLVAQARLDNSSVAAFVLPAFVNKDNQLFNVRNEYNGALIGSKLADEQFLYGKGAGRYPTSSAVLSDIAALRYGYRYEYKKSETSSSYRLSLNKVIKLFVSYHHSDEVNLKDFISVEENYSGPDRKYLIGHILLSKLKQAEWLERRSVSAITFTDQ